MITIARFDTAVSVSSPLLPSWHFILVRLSSLSEPLRLVPFVSVSVGTPLAPSSLLLRTSIGIGSSPPSRCF